VIPLVIRFKRPVYQPYRLFLSNQPRTPFLLHECFGFTLETTIFTHILATLARLGYIGEFEIVDDHRSGKIVVQLNGRLNKTGVISPRYNVQVNQIENWVNLLLPARGFGIIILVGRRLTTLSVRRTNLTVPDNLLGHLGPRRGSTEECWGQTAGICVLVSVFCTDVAT